MVAWGAWDGDVLVAQYSCLERQLTLPGLAAPALVGMSVNMATHPDYRGQGLIKQVAAPVYQTLRDRNAVAGVGFSNAAGVQVDRHSRGYGYQVIGQMLSVLAIVPPLRRAPSDFSITQTFPSTPFFVQPDSIHFSPTHDSITHRFALHPLRRYSFGVWHCGDTIRGLVIFQRTRFLGIPVVSLLAAYSDDPQGLLSCWLASLPSPRLVHLLTSPASPLFSALSRLTPTRTLPWTRSPYFLTFKPLTAELPVPLSDFNLWNCTGGDIL